jgi:hypothetical protein
LSTREKDHDQQSDTRADHRYAASSIALPVAALAQSAYTTGSELHCYYMTRDQCEQTVDYRGFCVPNPGVTPRANEGARRRSNPPHG